MTDGPQPQRRASEVRANVQRLIDKGASEDDIHGYLAAEKAAGILPDAAHSKFTPAQLVGRANRQVENAQEDLAASEPTDTQKALGGVAALARDIPGAEAAQAGVRALVRRQSYPEALGEIRTAEDANPVSTANRLVGATIATAALPKGLSATGRGALYGALRGGLEADPESLGQRAASSATQGVVGGLLGRLFTGARAAPEGESPAGMIGRKLYPTAAQDAGALADAGRNAVSGVRGLFASAAPAAEAAAPVASGVGPGEARNAFAQLLQKNLGEGAVGESVKGYPISGDPPSDPELMQRIIESLKRAKTAAPAFRPTGGQSSPMSVGAVRRAARP